MLKNNEIIKLRRDSLIDVLRDITYLQASLRNIEEYYYKHPTSSPDKRNLPLYALEKTRFITENQIISKLSSVRRILSEPFDDELGEDEMDDIERIVEKLDFWQKPGD